MAKCLYNTYSDNIAAYCHNSDHPYAMTVTQMNCKIVLVNSVSILKGRKAIQFGIKKPYKNKRGSKEKKDLMHT